MLSAIRSHFMSSVTQNNVFEPLVTFMNRKYPSKIVDTSSYKQYRLDSNEKHRIQIDRLLNHNAGLFEQENPSVSSNRPNIMHSPVKPYLPLDLNQTSSKATGYINSALIQQKNSKRSSISIASLISTDDAGVGTIVKSPQLPTPLPRPETEISTFDPRRQRSAEQLALDSNIIYGRQQTINQTVNPLDSLHSYTYLEGNISSRTNTDSVLVEPPAETPKICTTFITEPQHYYTYDRPILNKKRRRGNLPKEVTELLKRWLILHKSYPYPTEREKQQLADQTGLMVSQISNWFINARRRILQPLLESEKSMHNASSAQASPSKVMNLNNSHNLGGRINTAETSRCIVSNLARNTTNRHPSTDRTDYLPLHPPATVCLSMPHQINERKSLTHEPHTIHKCLTQPAENSNTVIPCSIAFDEIEGRDRIDQFSNSDETTLLPPPQSSSSSLRLPPIKILEKDQDLFRLTLN